METHGFSASSYDAPSFATMMGAANPGFVVASSTAWQPTAKAASTRTISIAPGAGVACGILGQTGAVADIGPFDANGGASNRFDTVVARYDWAIRDVVFTVLKNSPVTNTTNTLNSAMINRIPGVMYDGIVAIVRVRPGVTQFNADDVTDTRTVSSQDGAWKSYSVAWSADNQAPTIGNGTLTGHYDKFQRTCEVDIALKWGSTSVGGRGAWAFSLPFPAARETWMSVAGFTAAGQFAGAGFVAAGGSTFYPYLPVNGFDSGILRLRNADSTGAVSTGVPLFGGSYPWKDPGHNLHIFGRYETLL